MVLPLYDDNPFKLRVLPYATWSLMALNVVVFLITVSTPEQQQAAIAASFGVVPSTLISHIGWPEVTLVTGLFLHAGWAHIFGNMIYLWVFGDDIEDTLGPLRFLTLYLLAGAAAAFGYAVFNRHSNVPLIGASGAISGVLAAYLMLRPCAKVSVLLLRVVVRVQAFWVIGGWALLQLFSLSGRPNDDVAYLAHVSGFAAGALLFLALKPAGTRLFECIDEPERRQGSLQ